jgi:hypothetical protein
MLFPTLIGDKLQKEVNNDKDMRLSKLYPKP